MVSSSGWRSSRVRSMTRWAFMVVLLGAGPGTSRMAMAQALVEGTVSWQDEKPAAGVTLAMIEEGRTTTADDAGYFSFPNVRIPGRVSVSAIVNGRVVAREFTLVTRAVERVQLIIPGAAGSASTDPSLATLKVTKGRLIVKTADPASTRAVEGLLMPTPRGSVAIAPSRAAAVPTLEPGDAFKVNESLSGALADVGDRVATSGTTTDDTVVTYDGIRLFGADHAGGLVTAVNVDAVDPAGLTPDVAGARTSEGMPRIAEIATVTDVSRLRGMVRASALSASGAMGLPIGDRLSVFGGYRRALLSPQDTTLLDVGGRRATSSAITAPWAGTATEWAAKTTFEDMNGRVQFRPSPRTRLAFSGYRATDDIDFPRDVALPADLVTLVTEQGVTLDGGIFGSDVGADRQVGFGGSWDQEWHPRVRSSLQAARSDFDALTTRSVDVGGRFEGSTEWNVVDDMTVRFDVPVRVGASQELLVGGRHTVNRVRYRFATLAESATTDETLLTSRSSGIDRLIESSTTALYVEQRVTLPRVTATPGLRLTRFSESDGWFFEPSISVVGTVGSRLRLRVAANRQHQFVTRVVREDVLLGNRAFWAVADGSTIPVAASTFVTAGVSVEARAVLIDAGVVSRRATDVSWLTPRTRGAVGTFDLSSSFTAGTIQANGITLRAQYRAAWNTIVATYARLNVTNTFPGLGGTFAGDGDRDHEWSFLDNIQAGGFTLSTAWSYATGRPYTQPLGFGNAAIVVGDTNGARLPAYHRLDVAAHYGWEVAENRRATFGLAALNLYDRTNVWFKEFTDVEGQLLENDVRLIGPTLNAFFSFTF